MSIPVDASTLQSRDPEVVVAAKAEILIHHRAAVKAAVEVLKQVRWEKRPESGEFSSNDSRLVPIQILAELRAPDAVKELAYIIDVKTDDIIIFENRKITLGDYYPAAGALAKIGKPAVGQTVWELTKENSPQRRKNLCWILGEIEGRKAGRWRIEEKIVELKQQVEDAKANRGARPGQLQTQAEQIKRLRAAIPVLEELFEDGKQQK